MIFFWILLPFCLGALGATFYKRVGFWESLLLSVLMGIGMAIWPKGWMAFVQEDEAQLYIVLSFIGILFLGMISFLAGGIFGLIAYQDRFVFGSFYERFLAFRFLWLKEQQSHAVSLISILSVVCVCVATMGLVVVMSVMNGFGDDVRKKIVGSHAHLIVMKADGAIQNVDKLLKKLESVEGVLGASPFVLNEVMVSSDVNLSGAILKAIDPKHIQNVSDLPHNIQEGRLMDLKNPAQIQKSPFVDPASHEPLLPGILIGKEMAHNLRVGIGDPLNVISPIGELGPTGPMPKTKAFRVAGIFYTGMYEYDSKLCYVLLSEGQQFLGIKKGGVHGIEMRTPSVDDVGVVAKRIQKALGGYPYYTKDWRQMNQSLFSALKLEKIAMFLILAIIIAMASLLILVALILVVVEKRKEIAILKSMGATEGSIMKIFILYGLSIGSLGTLLGVFFGSGICVLIQYYGIELDPSVYYISYLPIRIEWFEIGWMSLGAILVSFFATVPPSLMAARLHPVEGLRD